ncbi:MAG: hypothetical protein CVV31_03395 [Methanomicrobiales archaeon HGW-Methanomicrobiales-2]|nr:MAG: hypothetical protein CVV31_03395 [Methanomicrobiales archaeon HGW-Methanomicrobiales-2]
MDLSRSDVRDVIAWDLIYISRTRFAEFQHLKNQADPTSTSGRFGPAGGLAAPQQGLSQLLPAPLAGERLAEGQEFEHRRRE